MPRRIRQSGSALRKLIRSVAAAGVVAGWEANGQEQFPRTTPWRSDSASTTGTDF